MKADFIIPKEELDKLELNQEYSVTGEWDYETNKFKWTFEKVEEERNG
jgi:hypothetical protein